MLAMLAMLAAFCISEIWWRRGIWNSNMWPESNTVQSSVDHSDFQKSREFCLDICGSSLEKASETRLYTKEEGAFSPRRTFYMGTVLQGPWCTLPIWDSEAFPKVAVRI